MKSKQTKALLELLELGTRQVAEGKVHPADVVIKKIRKIIYNRLIKLQEKIVSDTIKNEMYAVESDLFEYKELLSEYKELYRKNNS